VSELDFCSFWACVTYVDSYRLFGYRSPVIDGVADREIWAVI
jgi:hypothetical protein